MAWINNGQERSLVATVTKKLNNVIVSVTSYDGQSSFTFDGIIYPDLSDDELAQMSDEAYNARLEIVKLWIEFNEYGLDFDDGIIDPDYQPVRINYDKCAIPTTSTTTTVSTSSTTTSTTTICSTIIDVECATSYNAATYQVTPTYDGSGQTVHPDIYYNNSGWNGYKYWMAMTPYPNGNDNYENPSLLVSNDGDTWSVPAGVTNPLDPDPGGTYHNADSFLVYGYDNKLYLGWLTLTTVNTLYFRSSSDGVTWGTKVTPTFTTTDTKGSPTVIKENGKYTMYYVAGTFPYKMYRITSTSLTGTWAAAEQCNFTGIAGGTSPWHTWVTKYGNEYHCLLDICTAAGGANALLYFAVSCDGINWNVSSSPLINKTVSGWDNNLIYRSTAVLMNDGVSDYYDVWYSARSTSYLWHIGRTIVGIECGSTTTTTTTTIPTTTTTTSYAPTTLKTNLISVWEMDESSGNITYDSYSTNNLTNSSATVNQTGKINKAYLYNGTSSYLYRAAQLVSAFPLTISFWIKVSNSGVNRISTNGGQTNTYGVEIGFDYNQIVVEFGDGTGNGSFNRKTYTSSNTTVNGTWYHVVAIFRAHGDFSVYQDTVSKTVAFNSGTATTTSFAIGQFWVGRSWGAGTYFAKGVIDQVGIWNRELSTGEISTLYNSGAGLAYTSW